MCVSVIQDDGREWLAVNEVEGEAHAKQYLLALVWTLQTMSSVGHGSPLLTTPQERHFAVWGMIIGSCIFAYGITSSINFYKEMYEAQKYFRHKMDLLYELCQSKTIPGPLAARMRQLFHLQNKMKKGGAAVETQRHHRPVALCDGKTDKVGPCTREYMPESMNSPHAYSSIVCLPMRHADASSYRDEGHASLRESTVSDALAS
ncbi:unnamed protein product [Vitrella brassicaformis CCMP3155]|uniref:Potassium channel domain-containing protein n=1 Tax=Vitrella brassicaformis (strain CCMP3155) TaxID=1169540 RepID=A0A0G4EC65_VITBC|nr:unnamed protein product [Vitrella brassicaformis CCMP3155]|eukprot:CEL93083.1 unnamed protein product [Vitrella brassicaformis CCMP3155]